MEYYPPIKERSTEQLIDVIETREQWQPEVVESAEKELVFRGISLDKQARRRKNKAKYLKRIGLIKSTAEWTTKEMALITFFGPPLVVLLNDLFLFDSGEGVRRKNRQAIFCVLLGFGLWALTIYVVFTLFENKNYR
jgi:hypothetical protein